MSRQRTEQAGIRSITLIELLAVITVLGILVVWFFPFPLHRGRPPRLAKARTEMACIQVAINSYTHNYGRWPVSTNVEQSGLADFTFGTFETKTSSTVNNGGPVEANNSEVVSILMDATVFGNGKPTPNQDRSLNPGRFQFLNAKRVSDAKSSGVGLDGVYRDPWGNPYIITLDLNRDGKCRDAFHVLPSESLPVVTNGIAWIAVSTNTGSFDSAGKVLVWSFGPDGKADFRLGADQGVNKDNILGWR